MRPGQPIVNDMSVRPDRPELAEPGSSRSALQSVAAIPGRNSVVDPQPSRVILEAIIPKRELVCD
jgi:hypothetical protein